MDFASIGFREHYVKVLLIDDEPYQLKLLASQLASIGIADATCCETAEHALNLLTGGAAGVDLVFCDLQMPWMDGVEFVRHLAQIGYAGGLVLVSGEEERVLRSAQELARAHRLDMLGFLRKPVSPEKLRRLLEVRSGSRPARRGSLHRTYDPDELRRAIAGGELVNYYQPMIRVASGAVIGVETLVRWRHPRDGLVLPGEFIATAEEHGLIEALTHAVLIGALRQARIWKDMGLCLRVSVNVSMENLVALEFPEIVVLEAAKAGVDVGTMFLEVTESQLMKDPRTQLDVLARLRLKRIGLSIDDFGTGHSSLAQLRDIPFVELKLDRGFIHGACRDASLKAIFEASLGLARQLKMTVVAEGVEDRDDWNFVRAAGCDLAQGYSIARPMPPENLPAWMRVWESLYAELAGANP